MPAMSQPVKDEGHRMKTKGFTLIEVLIVMAVVAILVSIAVPSFQGQMRKSRRADAHAAMTSVQMAQERLRGNCRFYAQNLGGADGCGAGANATTVRAGATSSEGFYTIAIRAGSATGNGYVIEATPQGAQAKDTACNPIVLTMGPANPNGLKTPANCW